MSEIREERTSPGAFIMNPYPRVLSFGDQSLLVEFGKEIHPEINRLARDFFRRAISARKKGIRGVLPSYASVLIQFNPFLLSSTAAVSWTREILGQGGDPAEATNRLKEVPVVYGGLYGPDLMAVAERHGLDLRQVVRLHTEPTYLVYAIGGFPGLAAMGTVMPRIETPRMPTPRTKVPSGSVAVAGRQTGIYAIESPGGWRIIGRTPLRLFEPHQSPPSLFRPGDLVRFYPITENEFLRFPSIHIRV